MSMVVNTNVQALNGYRNLKVVSDRTSKSSEKLSSGYRINRAADDAAGLAISEKMRTQIRGLDRASSNSQDGISMIQTAEGALQETQDILQRMRELTLQASNETLTTGDREKIALELNELSDEIDSISEKTEFNTKKLIDGSWAKESIYLQTGANASQGMTFNISKMSAKALGVTKQDIGEIVAGNGVTDNNGVITKKNSVATTIELGTGEANTKAGTYVLESGIEITINQEQYIEIANGVFTTVNTITFSEDVTFAAVSSTTIVGATGGTTVNGDVIASGVTANGTNVLLSVGLTIKAGTYTYDQLTSLLAQAYEQNDKQVGVYDGDKVTTGFDEFILLDTSTNTKVLLTTSGALTIGGQNVTRQTNFSTLTSGGTAWVVSLAMAANTAAGLDAHETIQVNWTKNETNIGTAGGTIDVRDGRTADLGYEIEFDADDNGSIKFSQGFRDLISDLGGASTLADGSSGNEDLLNRILKGEKVSLFELNEVNITLKTGARFEFESDNDESLRITFNQYTHNLGTYDKKEVGASGTANSDSVGENISKLVDKIDSALEEVSMQRAKLGAYQNRLEHTIKNLDTSSENLSASESRIRDTDMAKEMMEYTSAQVLQQAGTTMLAQANSAPQSVLQLLG